MALVAAFGLGESCFAQKLVDPDAVAPEYRAAAEKRRAEQLKQIECGLKADFSKILPRDRADYITKCLVEGQHPEPDTAHP
jgi:hypothetical protein